MVLPYHRNANRNAGARCLVNSTLDRCNRRKTVGARALLSSLQHFRRLLRALGTSVVSGVVSRPPIEPASRRAAPHRAACTRAAPKTNPSVPLFRYSRMNGLTNRDNALPARASERTGERAAGVLASRFTFIVSEHSRSPVTNGK